MRKWIIALVLILTTVPACAAPARVWIAEFVAIRVEAAAPFATLPALARQTPLDISTGAKTSAVFNMQTRYIRIVCEVQCAVTAAGTATPSDILLPALRPEYFGVQGGKTISVILAP